MIDGINPYPAYKDSGVPWLGSVPEHWVVDRGKWLFGHKKDLNADGRQTNILSLTLRGVVNNDPDNPEGLVPKDYRTYQRFEKGDLVFKLIDLENLRTSRVGLVHEDGIMSSAYVRLVRRHGGVQRFFFHQYFDLYQRGIFNQLGAGVRSTLGPKDLVDLPILIPQNPEQAAIVHFLDHADRRIRRYIAAKKNLTALLNEQKQVTINSAVTRGLDPSVRLKPSGVEWLGDIPAHWEVVRAKRLFSPRRDLALPGDVQLSATQAYGVIPQAEFEAKVGRRVVKISMHLEQRRHVEKGDFVISMRSFQGGLERAWASGAIRSSYVVLKRAPLVDVGFFSYLFKSRGYIRALQATADFIRDGQDLNFGNFCDVGLPLVPLDEQKAIAASISGLTADIDVALAHTEREIALVREYRARLISDVVTGRLDVREAAERLPDEPEQPEPNDGPDAMTDTDDEIADDTNAVGEQVEV